MFIPPRASENVTQIRKRSFTQVGVGSTYKLSYRGGH